MNIFVVRIAEGVLKSGKPMRESAEQTCFETGNLEIDLPAQFLVFLELQGFNMGCQVCSIHCFQRVTDPWINTASLQDAQGLRCKM